MSASVRFFIFDGVGPVDGEFYTYAELLRIVGFHTSKNTQPDYEVRCFDPKAGTCIDVTIVIAADWWHSTGQAETANNIIGDGHVCWLAERFFGHQVDAMRNGSRPRSIFDITRSRTPSIQAAE
jgi:hypothetical protein